MLRLNKNRNVLCTLQARELNLVSSPYRLSLNILAQHIHSNNSIYRCVWDEKSYSPIVYDSGLFYFNNYMKCYTLYGKECKPSTLYHLKQNSATGKVLDVLSYTTPVYKDIQKCCCKLKKCICLSGYLMYVTKNNWLCQINLDTGSVITEIYVNPYGQTISFKHCDWNVYSKQITVTSNLCNYNNREVHSDTDIVVYLAVFTVSPVEFHSLFAIRKSVFGKNCKHVNVSDQILILGMGNDRIHMYNFSDILKSGKLTPYKLGDDYGTFGKIGTFPTGLPVNFTISSAPPLLFNLHCYSQAIDFGGFPIHYIYPQKFDHSQYIVRTLMENTVAKNGCIESSVWLSDEPYTVSFHPDGSNRIIHRTMNNIHCYEICNISGKSELKKTHTMGFPKRTRENTPRYSSFGRRVNPINILQYFEKTVLALDYEDELELLGILGIFSNDPLCAGFVKLYDSFTGKEVKCINIQKKLCDTYSYHLHIDLDSIVVLEKTSTNYFYANVYQLYI